MILAAGRGTRLGPLTDMLPKPLLPVANRPVMERGLACLHHVGVREVGINVSYRGAQIMETFGDGSAHGVTIHWAMEEEPTGTAGGLKGAQPYLDDDLVIVIAGDAMLDVDLTPLLAAHRAHDAFASLGTIAVEDPSQYGVVVTDADRRVVSFQEKPAPGTEISRLANTGIYLFHPKIFELIPANTFHDFALNVFPEILARRLPFFAFPVEGYWTDIGHPGEYLRANLDYLQGGITRHAGRGETSGTNLIGDDAGVEDATLEHCVIGERVVLPAGTTLTECVVWPDTRLTVPLTLRHAVLTPQGVYGIHGKDAVAMALAEV